MTIDISEIQNVFISITYLTDKFYLCGIFTHLKLCIADAMHNFKWVKIIHIWHKREVNYFEI